MGKLARAVKLNENEACEMRRFEMKLQRQGKYAERKGKGREGRRQRQPGRKRGFASEVVTMVRSRGALKRFLPRKKFALGK